MNDNTEPPAAERWRALAGDSHAVAEGMTDPEAKLIMRQLALGYDWPYTLSDAKLLH